MRKMKICRNWNLLLVLHCPHSPQSHQRRKNRLEQIRVKYEMKDEEQELLNNLLLTEGRCNSFLGKVLDCGWGGWGVKSPKLFKFIWHNWPFQESVFPGKNWPQFFYVEKCFFDGWNKLDNGKLGSTQQQKTYWHWHVARIISTQKIYGLYARKHHIVEMRGGVTNAGRQTNDKQLKKELVSQWKLEAESRNFTLGPISKTI